MANKSLNVPSDVPLIEGGENLPFVTVGDEAFPLKPYILRPYNRQNIFQIPNKIFNYRLSRGRRVVKNAFGILANCWRIFLKPMEVQPAMADIIITAAVCLHNMLCTNTNDTVTPGPSRRRRSFLEKKRKES